ncbi:MAG TPA: hypothetical protein VEL11_13410 [Candidatus Bathyarchaeia archaeon]|nr:hypothetical protein [Candidatus Bathyarchaeia archaeon]
MVLSVQVKSLLSIQSTLVVLTRYNRARFNASIFLPTGNQFDLLNFKFGDAFKNYLGGKLAAVMIEVARR